MTPGRGVKPPGPCRRCGCAWKPHTHWRTPALTLRAAVIYRRYAVTENECSACGECPQYLPPRRREQEKAA